MHVWKEKKERNTSWKKMDRTLKHTKIQNLFGLKTERKKKRLKLSNGQLEENLLYLYTTEVPYWFGS